jgi:hypothetical protein
MKKWATSFDHFYQLLCKGGSKDNLSGDEKVVAGVATILGN